METEKCYQRDIEVLNRRYIECLKHKIGNRIQLAPILQCRPSAIDMFRVVKSVKTFVAVNVLQYKIVITDCPINEPQDSILSSIIGETLLLYRELTRQKISLTQHVTGHSPETAKFFSNMTFTELSKLANSNKCVIQMRFFDNYWKNIKSITADGKETFLLTNAAQAASEVYHNAKQN